MNTDKILATLTDLQALAVDGITLAKKPSGVGTILRILGILGDVQALAKDAPEALPALENIDAAEAAAIGGAAFTLVKAVLAALAA